MNLRVLPGESVFLPLAICEEFATLEILKEISSGDGGDASVQIDPIQVSKEALISISAWIEWHQTYDSHYPRLATWTDRKTPECNRAAWLNRIAGWYSKRPQHVVEFQDFWFKNCILLAQQRHTCALLGAALCAANYLECEPFLHAVSQQIYEAATTDPGRLTDRTALASALFK